LSLPTPTNRSADPTSPSASPSASPINGSRS
jgi:hypothetical protein